VLSLLSVICRTIVPDGKCSIGNCQSTITVVKNYFNINLNVDDCASRAVLKGIGGNEKEIVFDSADEMAAAIAGRVNVVKTGVLNHINANFRC